MKSHLQTCTACSALAEVDLALKSVKPAEPAQGFSDRFQVRLAAQRKAARQRNTAGFILLTVSVLAAVTWLAWPYLGGSLRSPSGLLSSWLATLFTLWTDLRALLHAGWVVVNVVPSFLWALFVFTATTSSLLWALSLVKLNKVMQGVQS